MRYGFVSKKVHDQFKVERHNQFDFETLNEYCKKIACRGFYSKHLKIAINKNLKLRSLDDFNAHFAVTFHPDTGLINYGAKNKYALVHIQHLSGKWVDDKLADQKIKYLDLHYQYHDFNVKHHFPVFDLRCKGKSLRVGELQTLQHEFFLFDQDKTETRLHIKS